MTFGELMRARMSALDLSQAQVARLLREAGAPTHPNMISRWANGHACPTRERLEALLDVLQVKEREERAEACRLAAGVSARPRAQGDQHPPLS